jgi:hypothetical protein
MSDLVEFIPGTETPDRNKFLFQVRRLRRYLLSERVHGRMLRELASDPQMKYFYVKAPMQARNIIKQRVLNSVVHLMQERIPAPSCPSRKDFEALVDRLPMNLYEIARLHVALTSELLDGSQVAQTLDYYQLRGGLLRGSVVPALRVFDPVRFAEARASVNADLPAIAREIMRFTPGGDRSKTREEKLRLVEHQLNALVSGTDKGERFRITTPHAALIHRILTSFNVAAESPIPPLDVLFSDELRVSLLGTNQGTRPLSHADYWHL